jgi:sarcosine oxidase subunit beta
MSIKPYGFWNQTAHGNLLVTDVNAPLDQFPRHDVGYDVIEFLCHCTAKMFSKINVGQLSLIRTYSGWNEASPDGCCMIGFARSPENFFVNAGYSGHGFCLGPASGIACADLILNGSTSVPVQELSYSRFDII